MNYSNGVSMYFDAKAAKQLQPGSHIVVEGCLGLRLEVSAKSRSWTYRYKSPVDSRMRQIKLGQWPAMPASAAAARWQELKALRDSGVDPAQQKKEQRKLVAAGVYTVLDVLADYVAGHLNTNRKAGGANAVAARLHKAIAPLAKTPAASLTRRMAFDLIAGLIDTPVVAKSVRNEMGAAWDLALDAGKLPEDAPNWWRQIMAGKLRSKGAVRDGEHKGTGKRVLSDRELGQLLVVDFPLLAATVQDVLTLYLWTATRGGEIVQMHATQITEEPDGLWWTMPKALSKNAKREAASDLRVPLVGRAKEVVDRRLLINPGGYLFAAKSKEGYTAQAGVQSQVNFRQPYCKSRPDITRTRLSVTHWSPHDLRRTARTMLASMGCPNEVAESILGHVQPGVQGIYNRHSYDAERRLWLQRWSDRLDALVQAHQAPAPAAD
jgi:integrase